VGSRTCKASGRGDPRALELFGDEGVFQREGSYAVQGNDEFTVDVIPSACAHGWAELAPYVEQRRVDNVTMPVLRLAGLLLTDEGTRDKDRMDAAILRKALDALTVQRRDAP
jgi:hypothetical protein